MTRNILLTSLSAAENDIPVRYFSVKNEFDFDYCDALLDAEAGIKALTARYDIDEIIVIGGAGSFDERDEINSVSIGHGSVLYSADKSSLSTYGLLQYRLAQYADELAMEQKEEDERLSGEVREKLIRFIQDLQNENPGDKKQKLNRLFDTLAQNGLAYEDFRKSLSEAYPELRDDSADCIRWIKSYLYSELKLSAKLELLSVNEDVSIRFIPEERIVNNGQWADSMMTMPGSIIEDKGDVNLYISLNSDDAADTFILINLLDILISMPGSGVHLKKLFTVRSLHKCMTGIIRDDTEGFGITELFHAISSFLNYGKADMIVDIWEKSGERNESIAGMIYAIRHIDVGLSICNIPEIEGAIIRLRKLFRDEKFWRESGYYGMLFSIIAESIREDYGTLLEGEGDISFIELVKWAYRHQFYQQTLTLIEARAPENLVRSGVFYYCNDVKSAEQVVRLLAERRLELKPYEYYKMDDIEHYFIKTYNRAGTRGMGGRNEDPQRMYAALRTQSVDNKDPSVITGFTACDSRETLQSILFAYYNIGVVRNKISHAETEALEDTRLIVSERDESPAMSWMKDSIDFFIDSYEKAMAEVQDKKVDVVLITSGEVRTAAERMKYEKHKGS